MPPSTGRNATPDCGHRGRRPVQHEGSSPQCPARRARGVTGGKQQAGRDRVVRAQPKHGPHRALLARAEEEAGVHERHHQVTDPERHAGAVEGARDRECDDQEPCHADQHQQPGHGPDRWHRVGQPGVAAIHPPDVAEDQRDPRDTDAVGLGHQNARQLRDREDEHQVEEQLDRRYPYIVHARDGRLECAAKLIALAPGPSKGDGVGARAFDPR